MTRWSFPNMRFFSLERRHHFALMALTAVGAACSSSSDQAPAITCGRGTHQSELVCVADTLADGGLIGDERSPTSETGAAVIAPPTFAGVTSVAPAGLTSLQVTWSAATDPTTPSDHIAYNVYVATAAGAQNFAAPTATAPPGSTSLLLNSVTGNQKYFVVVRAVNSAAVEDKNATEQSATTQADTAAPTFAGAVTAEPAADSALKISWAAATDTLTPAPGITYLVYVSTTAGGEDLSVPTTVSDVGATNIVVKHLPLPDTTYYVVVRARDAAGNFDTNKVEVSGKAGKDTAVPTFAGCTSATVKDAGSITLSWNAAVDDTTAASAIQYDVFASKTPGGQDFTTPTKTFVGANLGVVEGLTQATQYYFVCRARDASKNTDTNKSERTATTLSDAKPPTFAGLTTVTNVLATSVDLTWAVGSDDQTAVGDIVYDVYQAASAGAEIFTVPVASSAPGATTISVTGLESATTYFWVVRARDKAGNHDGNVIEKTATTSVSFAGDVMPVMLQHCAVQGCHLAGTPPYGLVLAPAAVAFGNLFNVASGEVPASKRVVPYSPATSYLVKKILGTASIGEVMPPLIRNDALSASEKTIIQNWILQGASQN